MFYLLQITHSNLCLDQNYIQEEIKSRLKFSINCNFKDRFSKNTEIQNFMLIRPVGAELFHANRQTSRQK
jgi:hypothetical protein